MNSSDKPLQWRTCHPNDRYVHRWLPQVLLVASLSELLGHEASSDDGYAFHGEGNGGEFALDVLGTKSIHTGGDHRPYLYLHLLIIELIEGVSHCVTTNC